MTEIKERMGSRPIVGSAKIKCPISDIIDLHQCGLAISATTLVKLDMQATTPRFPKARRDDIEYSPPVRTRRPRAIYGTVFMISDSKER
jgi:hypothetical protein